MRTYRSAYEVLRTIYVLIIRIYVCTIIYNAYLHTKYTLVHINVDFLRKKYIYICRKC